MKTIVKLAVTVLAALGAQNLYNDYKSKQKSDTDGPSRAGDDQTTSGYNR